MCATRNSPGGSKPGIWRGALDARYDALIVANGTPPSRGMFENLRTRCGAVIALDGGLNVLRRWNAVPQHVIGDLDSATAGSLAWSRRHGAEVHPRPSQEIADIDKGFALCRKLKYRSVLVTAADGDALDHVLNSLSAAANAKLQVTLATGRSVARVLRGRVRVAMDVPQKHTVSWFGCPHAGPCSLQGVVWPFEERELAIGGFGSLSNLPDGNRIVLKQGAGVSLFVVSLKPKNAGRLQRATKQTSGPRVTNQY